MRVTRNPTKRPPNITEGQPLAQRENISDESTKSTADVAESLPAPPSTLTCVKSEPLDEEPQPQASTTSLSAISLPPMPPPPPPPATTNTSSSTKPPRKKRKPKPQANTTALGVSGQPKQLPVEPFKTFGVSSIASASTSALMGFPESSMVARGDGVLLPSQMTPFSLDSMMNRSMGNITGYPTPSAQTEALAATSNPTDPAFRRTGPITMTSASAAAPMTNALSYGAVCNDGSSLLLQNTPAPPTGIMNPSLENMAGLSTPNAQASTSAFRSSEPAAMQAPTSGLHPPPMTSTSTTLATTPLQNLVNSLALHYQQEDSIRTRISQLDQSITSVLGTLHALKMEREELQVRETYTRKRRMEVLQCLQRATLGMEGNTSEQMLPGQSRTTADVLPPHLISGANQAFVAPQIPQGASAFALGQVTGVQPQASEMFNLATGAPAARM
ncbi:hypothetical protein MTO96_011973 [Rhipicephalus appendiculatus]